MTAGAGAFNKAASKSYGSLPEDEKDRLKTVSLDTERSPEAMTCMEIMRAGAKAFKKIHKQVQLQVIYYLYLHTLPCAVSRAGEAGL